MTCRMLPLIAAIVLGPLALDLAAAPKKLSSSSKKKTTSTVSSKPANPYPIIWDEAVPAIAAESAIVVDAATGKVLYERNADDRRPVASTQKLMTGLLIAEDGNLNETVRVKSSDTWCEPTKLYMKAGKVYRRHDLLKILLVKSMNDVALCLARDNAGSVEAFAEKMNERARELGMRNSNFVNPNGLPAPRQYSTARDMAKLALHAYRNRTVREIIRIKSLPWKYPSGKTTTFSNTNRVLKNFPYCNGMKTGYTQASGFCLISSATLDGRDVIAVVLGDKKTAIWTDSYRLLAWGLGGGRDTTETGE